ncbi:hypothetical protein BpHYR1_017029 [Brachionus plicatilis]|uniref:Uncharacterized protein n=1 Tax=Brachionus plicatilis TaxID=10195 RepID=A0A3M7QPF9_BRAPC|nr:hypothetical protein BpHYR1_017029 [Brachionus plicatilis]
MLGAKIRPKSNCGLLQLTLFSCFTFPRTAIASASNMSVFSRRPLRLQVHSPTLGTLGPYLFNNLVQYSFLQLFFDQAHSIQLKIKTINSILRVVCFVHCVQSGVSVSGQISVDLLQFVKILSRLSVHFGILCQSRAGLVDLSKSLSAQKPALQRVNKHHFGQKVGSGSQQSWLWSVLLAFV